MTTRLLIAAAGWAVLALAGPAANGAGAPEVNPDAAVLADFKARVATYMELHGQLAKGSAELEETKDPAKIREPQLQLAARIREARKDAKPGDIFTPEIRAKFRELMYPQVKGAKGRQTKAAMKEDAPASVPLKVNASYPEGAPLPTVPPNILANLPRLPEELEYRVINRHLILRDVAANLIVDFIPNAIR
jgi:hypothetical protein